MLIPLLDLTHLPADSDDEAALHEKPIPDMDQDDIFYE